jgi:hypothetical protein
MADVNVFSSEELCSKLKQVTLRGSSIQPYLNSHISIEQFNPKNLSPCQRYVLLPVLRKLEQLRWDIQSNHNCDILRLNGYLKVAYPSEYSAHGVVETVGQTIDILPPVCEEFINDFGELMILVNDGMHRVYLAYQMGIPINVAYVRGVDKNYPYYAYKLPCGFNEVEIINEIPHNYLKKFHVAKEHKKLYRWFNSEFENIGESRPYEKKVEER